MNASSPFTDLDDDGLAEFFDYFTNLFVIRRIALSPQWTDRLHNMDAVDLECLVSAYQVIASEAANILAMGEWLQDPLYRQAIGLDQEDNV